MCVFVRVNVYYLNALHIRESVFVCVNVYYLSLSNTSEREIVHVRFCL